MKNELRGHVGCLATDLAVLSFFSGASIRKNAELKTRISAGARFKIVEYFANFANFATFSPGTGLLAGDSSFQGYCYPGRGLIVASLSHLENPGMKKL